MGTSSPDAAAATALGTVLDVWPNDGRGVVPLIDVVGALETLVHGVWALYRYFDERDFLRECYPVLRALAFASSEREQGLLRDGFDTRLCGEGLSGTVVATANLFGAMKVLGRIAGVLTHLADYEHIEARADEMKKAFRLRFLTQSGHFAIDSQSAFVAALHHGLLEAGESTLAQNRLIELIEKANYHCDVAPAVVGAVLPTLTQAGRLDLAYMLLLQTSEPSWLHNVEAGYQLVGRHPQQFDIAQAGILRWIVESMVGLSLDDDYSRTGNGFRKVRVRPRPPLGRLFQAGAPIQSVEASLNTVNGRFTVSWRMAEDSFEVNLVVPPNCQASVTLPDDIEQQVRSGTHQFTMRFDAGGDGIPILLDRDGVNERRA
jgi:alpha-L-rhamnosidase